MTLTTTCRLQPLLNPRSIALIGVSSIPGKVGYQVLRNLLDQGYAGKIYPIHSKEKEIIGLRTYPQLGAITDDIDLLAIMVPPASVSEVLRACPTGQVKSAVIFAAGFAETGPRGLALQEEVSRIGREAGITLLGPNTNAFVNADARINLTFQPFPRMEGCVAVVSQSGAVGAGIIFRGLEQSIGFGKFISLGNRIDVDETEVLEYLGNDSSIRLIAFYLESIGRGRAFMSAARRIAPHKPILVLKVGGTVAGRRSALSHTASISGEDSIYDAAFRECGVLRVNNPSELLDGIAALLSQPPLEGTAVGIITSAGGMGTITADFCERSGLQVPPLSSALAERLRRLSSLPMAMGNPVDIILADDKVLEDTTQEFLLSPQFHGLIWNIIVNPFQTHEGLIDVWRRQASTAKRLRKPVVCCLMGRQGTAELIRVLRKEGLPAFDSPEKAVFALTKLREYAVLRSRCTREASSVSLTYGIDIGAGREPLRETEARELCCRFAIPFPAYAVARTAVEALQRAEEIGYPVVLKLLAAGLLHRSDVGGVALDVETTQDICRDFERLCKLAADSGHAFEGVLVDRQMPPGLEMIVGAVRDRTFGPLVMVGIGGIFVEVVRDVAYRICPCSRSEALAMLDELRGSSLLNGVRGQPATDKNALAEIIIRASELIISEEGVLELDLNPVVVYPKGAIAVDAKIIRRTSGLPVPKTPS